MLKRTLPAIALLALALAAGSSQAATTGAATPRGRAKDRGRRQRAALRQQSHGGRASRRAPVQAVLRLVPPGPGRQGAAPDVPADDGARRDLCVRSTSASCAATPRSCRRNRSSRSPRTWAAIIRCRRCARRSARATLRSSMHRASRRRQAGGSRPRTPGTSRADDAQITAADLPRLELKWAFAFPNAQRARSQPAVAYGAVYVGSQDGTVYALDEETGCVRWTFRAPAEVRTAVIVESPAAAGKHAGSPLVFFGDLLARVYAVDAFTGAAALVVQGRRSPERDDHRRARRCTTARCTCRCLRSKSRPPQTRPTSAARSAAPCWRSTPDSGTSRWKAYTIPTAPREVGRTRVGTRILAPSGAPVWNSPAIDAQRGVLYVGTGENYSSPANDTQRRLDCVPPARTARWSGTRRRRPTMPGTSPACCRTTRTARRRTVRTSTSAPARSCCATRSAATCCWPGQKSGWVYGVDPDARGKIVWSSKVGRGGIQGGVHFGMATDGERLFVPISDMKDEHDGRKHEAPVARRHLRARPAHRQGTVGRSGRRRLRRTPVLRPGHFRGVTSIPGAVFAGHMDGRLRAYDAATGKVRVGSRHDAGMEDRVG